MGLHASTRAPRPDSRPGVVVRVGKSRGEFAPALPERQYRSDVRHGRSRSERRRNLQNDFSWFVGIDWGSQKHRICLLDRNGKLLHQRWVEHSGSGLAELVDWLRQHTSSAPGQVAVAIEVPRGAIVETLIEQGFAVFFLNPKQLDRFRDRFTPSGAKDDQRDARVLADSLRTDRQAFHPVRLDDPTLIRLRELSRLDDTLSQEHTRLTNQLWAQLHRFFPQLLQLSPAADEPWLWDLLEKAPTPAQAAKLTAGKITNLLSHHGIRRLDAQKIRAVLAKPPLVLAPGAAEAASEHALLLLPRLRLLRQQRTQLTRRIDALLQELADVGAEAKEHRDVTILLSLPGVGRKVTATMLSEASEAIANRDYHALRCLAGSAPVTRQSGTKKAVLMRYGCNHRLRNALYHWSRVSAISDPHAKQVYSKMRAQGHSHGRALRGIADRSLATMISMLRHRTLYDPARRSG
jgi:transposase